MLPQLRLWELFMIVSKKQETVKTMAETIKPVTQYVSAP